mmetsp:Transcript_10939/g.15413  ORF Transcript_10939/g.15413 Transcript_10939/m.15413 type:complete len:189 (-) Transcript_10939:361-927(-)
MIDPATNPNGETFKDYNNRRWGGSGWTKHLKQEGQKDNLGANFANWKWWPNTLNAHRLVWYATENTQKSSSTMIDTSTANQILFEAIYEQGENISLVDTLVKIGTTKFGFEKAQDELESFLHSDDGTEQVQKEISYGRRTYGISSVPFFIIGPGPDSNSSGERRPYGISGAQKTKTFANIFHELLEDE